MVDQSDTSWERLEDAPARLRWARLKSGLTQEQAGGVIGLKRTAYLKYEAAEPPQTALKYDQARRLGRRLKVRWEWLIEGTGLPWPGAVDEITDLAAEAAPADQERIREMVRIMLDKKAG